MVDFRGVSGSAWPADLAQLVEQLFRKQQVWGSSPQVGSTGPEHDPDNAPKWRNRQTRYVQGVVGLCPWEFKSPLRHQVAVRPARPDGRQRGHRRLARRVTGLHIENPGMRTEGWSLAAMARGKSEL